jgi:hypothetical protein
MALEKLGGVHTKAAEMLGMSFRSLLRDETERQIADAKI